MDTDTRIADKLLSVVRLWHEASDIIYSGVQIDKDKASFHMAGYEVLSQIDNGTTTTKELAVKANSTMANITHLTKTLEEIGCIRREVGEKDKRVWNFHITSKGRNMLHAIRSHHAAAVNLFCSHFTEDQKKSVLAFLEAIETHLNQFVRTPAQERAKILQQGNPELTAYLGSAKATSKRSHTSQKRSSTKGRK